MNLSEKELSNIRSIKYSKNKSIDTESKNSDLLPEGCFLENCYTIAIWYGDGLWAMKFFEYRIRWWKKPMGGSDITVYLISQKFLIGDVLDKDDEDKKIT